MLGASLAAIHAAALAAGEPYEVLVVDDGSTDSTAAVAERHDARVVRVCHRQIVRIARRGRSGIRLREGLELRYGQRRDDPRQDA